MANNLNFYRGQYSDFLSLLHEGKVIDTNLYFTIPDTTPTEDPKSQSYCVFMGSSLLASATHEADLNTVIGDVAKLTTRIDNISSELAEYTVSAITVSDANVKEAYQMVKTVDSVSTPVGEVIKVYKDSALQNVELSGQTLVFTYLTASGSSQTVSVDVSLFLAQSEFKNGLLVSDNGEVSVKVGENITDTDGNVTSKNFLEFEGEVEGEKALAVRSMDTDVTVITKDIVIAGGPLDTPEARKALSGGTDDAGNFVIKEGTDIQQLLINLFTKETYPATLAASDYTKASATAAMNNLTLTLNVEGDQEVGTLVTLTSGCTNGSLVSSTTNSSIKGLTYGWSKEDDDKKDSSETTIISTIKADTVADDTYTISATINSGFNADTVTNKKTTPATVTGTSSAELATTNLGCIVEGTNKITINATGASYSYSAASISSGYCVSNVGNTDSAHTYNGVEEVNTTTSKPTKSANKTVTGKYYYFMGGSQLQDPALQDKDGNFLLNSAAIRALGKSGWVTKDGTTSIGTWQSPGYSVVIACPDKYKLATITDSMGNSYLGKFSKTATIPVQTGAITTNYKVYMYPLENNDKMDFKGITLTKA